MRKPPKLTPGDTVAAISLSWGGPGTFPARYAVGKRQLQEAFGLHVVETRHALKDANWLARNPQARAEDLMEAFADPDINGRPFQTGGNYAARACETSVLIIAGYQRSKVGRRSSFSTWVRT